MTISVLPFTAVVGQDPLKTALILAAIEPRLAGVLIAGPRGMAKSTLARGLAALDRRAAGCFVTLPLGATEEQVIGTLDLSRALGAGEVAYKPGLLGRAHGGYLYIDEVNLLADPLVDVLLDVAASKINHIERDGISHAHAADFVLIGTMNPDEGTLRPQFSDRFGLCVELPARLDVAERRAVVDRRLAYEADPASFVAACQAEEQALADTIEAARLRVVSVDTPDAVKDIIASRCAAADVEGIRADLHWRQAARAHAAWHERTTVTAADVEAVAEFVLCHRRGEKAGDTPPPTDDGDQGDDRSQPPSADRGAVATTPDRSRADGDTDGDWGQLPPRHVRAAPSIVLASSWQVPASRATVAQGANPTGRLSGQTASQRGPAATGPAGARIDWFRTLAARRIDPGRVALPVYRPQPTQESWLECVLLDTSASTLGRSAQARARAGVMAIADAACRARRQLAVMTFGGSGCDWLLEPGRARHALAGRLARQPAGGGTPLRAALLTARRRLMRVVQQAPGLDIRAWLITDARSRDEVADIRWPWPLIVVDAEDTRVPLGRARHLAQTLGGQYVPLDALGRPRP